MRKVGFKGHGRGITVENQHHESGEGPPPIAPILIFGHNNPQAGFAAGDDWVRGAMLKPDGGSTRLIRGFLHVSLLNYEDSVMFAQT